MYKIGNKASISPYYKKAFTSAQGFIKMVETKRDKVNYPFAKDKLASGFTDLCFSKEV